MQLIILFWLVVVVDLKQVPMWVVALALAAIVQQLRRLVAVGQLNLLLM